MNASAHRISGFRHVVKVRQHRLNVDEPVDQGGDDAAPSPQELLAASLASCTAVTMEMYADRKGWDLGPRRGRVRVHARRARLPDEVHADAARAVDLTDEQVQRLKVIATKCPVHRTLDGEVMFDERVERIQLAA